jgi:hypothetical protein
MIKKNNGAMRIYQGRNGSEDIIRRVETGVAETVFRFLYPETTPG